MGKGLAFLNLKFFHPSNKDNQKRKWEAMQREKERMRKERERKQELLQEKEIRDTKEMLYKSNNNTISHIELKKNELEWMYNEPPGLKKSMENAKKKIEEQNRLNEWQNALNKMDKNERRLAEREIENGLTVHERNVFRFEFLKNAPVVADYVKNMEVTHKPFGIQIRQVKCFKCNKWGHRIGDRECPLNNDKPYLDDTFKNKMDPINKIKKTMINKHVTKYNNDSNNGNNKRSMDTQSVLTMKTDGNDMGNTYQMKRIFNTNDGSKFELISGSDNDNSGGNQLCEDKKKRKKKRKKRKRDRNSDDIIDDEDLNYIQSLSVKEREYLLKKLKKDQKKKKRHKHDKRKKKRRKYSDNISNDSVRKRSRSRSRSRNRNHKKSSHKHKKR